MRLKLIAAAAMCGVMAMLAAPMGAQNQNSVMPGPANIGGVLYASNFAQWTIAQGSSPANGQISWSSNTFCKVTSGGITFTPLAVGVPIQIVDNNPAHSETVTITSFQSGNNGCSIQAPMSFVHYSYHLASATAGLQEAIDWAANTPYMIVVTPDFTRSGGTTGTITSASGNSNVSILDQRTSVVLPYVWNTGSNVYVAQPFSGGGGGGQVLGAPQFRLYLQPNSGTQAIAGPATTDTNGVAPILQGVANTDLFSGVTGFQSSAQCTNADCVAQTPPSSTDTFYDLPLATTSTNSSSSVEDLRNNTRATYGVNPPPSKNLDNFTIGNQIYQIEAVDFTHPSPPPTLGAIQTIHQQIFNATTPGFSAGIFGCPLFCPPAGYSNINGWTVTQANNQFMNVWSEGIKQQDGVSFFVYSGKGDSQQKNDFNYYSGGFRSPSDEGEKWAGIHQTNIPDVLGTIASMTDSSHYVINATTAPKNQGDGRLILDMSAPITVLSPITNTSVPTSTTAGTLSFDRINLPVSTAIGHVDPINGCPVPAQTGGFATVTNCKIIVDSGVFDTTANKGIASEANPTADLENLGINIASAGALSGGAQLLTMDIHQSLPGGALICQGGLAGSAVEFLADSNNVSQGGLPVSGRVIPIFCSPDAHTVWYDFANASQLWASAFAGNTQQKTTQIAASGPGSGAFQVNLTRTANVVTGVVTNGNTTQYQYSMSNQKFYSVTGCSDSTMNFTGGPDPIILLHSDPTGSTFRFTQSGSNPDSTCTGGILEPQKAYAAIYPAAEIYDVSNPVTGRVDGTIVATPQPAFRVGHSFKIPVNASAALNGIALQQQLAQPTFTSSGMSVDLIAGSAIGATAFQGSLAQPFDSQMIGSGGNIQPSNLLVGDGQFSCGLCLNTAPYRDGTVLGIGFASCGDASVESCPLFLQYNIEQAEGGTVVRSFNENTQTFTQTIGLHPVWTLSPTAFTLFNSTILQNTQFMAGDPVTGQNVPQTQMRNITSIGNGGGFPGYDNVLQPAVVTATTTGITQYIYSIAVHYPYGDSYTPIVPGVSLIFNGAATPNNRIDCGVIPAGLTGEVVRGVNPNWMPVGPCPNNTASVVDTGTYGTSYSWSTPSLGAPFLTGAVFANQYSFFTNAQVPWTGVQSAGFSQKVDGIISVDTSTVGNGLGEIDAGAMKVSGSPVCTVASPCGGAGGGVSSIDTQTGAFTFSGPGVSHVGNAYTFTGTGTGVGSVGLSAPSWFAVSGSPVTSSGTLALTAATGQTSHQVIGTCGSATSFAPCSLTAADIPSLPYVGSGGFTTGFIMMATSTTAIANSHLDDGVTAGNTLSYSGANGFASHGTSGVQLALNSTSSSGTQETLASTGGDTFLFGTAGSAGSLGNPANSWYVRDNTAGINMMVLTATAQYFNGPLIVNGLTSLTGTAAGTTGHCVQYTGTFTVGDAGAACGSGGAITLASVGAGASPTGLFDFSAATQLKLPTHAGYTAAAAGEIGYDSTNGNVHFNFIGTDLIAAGFPSSALPTSGNCAKFVEIGAWWEIADAGVPCGSGSGITAVSIASANGISGTSSGGSTPALTIALGAITPTSVASTGPVSGTGFSTSGTTQGLTAFAVGTGTITGTLPTNYVGIIAPASGTPAYFLQLPSANPTAGQMLTFAAPTTINGLNQAVGTWFTPFTPLTKVTTTVGTTAIAANTCATAVTVTMTGLATTNTLAFTPTADVSGTTGWGATGGLTIDAWPTANTVNYKVCNQTAASITPGASVTFNVSAQ